MKVKQGSLVEGLGWDGSPYPNSPLKEIVVTPPPPYYNPYSGAVSINGTSQVFRDLGIPDIVPIYLSSAQITPT